MGKFYGKGSRHCLKACSVFLLVGLCDFTREEHGRKRMPTGSCVERMMAPFPEFHFRREWSFVFDEMLNHHVDNNYFGTLE